MLLKLKCVTDCSVSAAFSFELAHEEIYVFSSIFIIPQVCTYCQLFREKLRKITEKVENVK